LTGIGFGVRNFQKLALCLKEIARVLKPGGRFLTIEMFKSTKNTLTGKSFKLYFQKIVPKIGSLVSKSDYAYDYLFDSVDNFLNVKDYSKLVKAAGMEVEYVKNNFLNIVHTVIAVKK
jgi:demethylmenaquinone methyltransferase/2-methoxy-6-polyprenyl-1,4-benzoquinol methylase